MTLMEEEAQRARERDSEQLSLLMEVVVEAVSIQQTAPDEEGEPQSEP